MNLWSNWFQSAAEKRQEQLSAYLDGQLSTRERRQLEQQLAADAALQADLEQQRLIKSHLSQLPRRRAPRNFMLDPVKYGRPAPPPTTWLYPTLRSATALAAFFFVLVVVLELLSVTVLPSRLGEVAMEQAPAPAAPVLPEAASLPELVEATRVVAEEVVTEADMAAMSVEGEMPQPAATAAAAQELTFEAYPPPSPAGPGMATSRAEATAAAEVKIPTPVLAAPLEGDTVPIIVEESVVDPQERAMLLDARPFPSVWRLLQMGSGIALLLLAVATLWLRRRQI